MLGMILIGVFIVVVFTFLAKADFTINDSW